jgi:hypothetical protein
MDFYVWYFDARAIVIRSGDIGSNRVDGIELTERSRRGFDPGEISVCGTDF